MLLLLVVVNLLSHFHFMSNAQKTETVTGTVFCNNDFSLYINGELVAVDPIPTTPHNAVNVSFRVETGKDITFAIDARDLASNDTGLEFDNRCLGSGGLRAMFSNGVVTNSKWVCSTYHYGPVNWRECFGAQRVRNYSLQLLPGCITAPQLEDCFARRSEKPEGWLMPNFDDSHWEYAQEWDEDYVGWGLRPEGCDTNSSTIISPQLDPNDDNITCPENLDWGNSVFIWRPDLNLDNHLLCRYTLKVADDADGGGHKQTVLIGLMIFLISLTFVF